jgi:general secretion pathway protein M
MSLQTLRADAEAFLARLSPRERVMVSLAAGAVALFALMLVSMRVSGAIRAREGRIADKTQVLSQVGQLAQGYRRAQADRALLEAKLKTKVPLMSFVSQTGTRLGIEVNDLRPGQQQGDKGDKVSEESVEVSFPKLDLMKLTALLTELERGPGIVRVRRIAVRGRNDDPAAVDVTLVVATWEMKG